MKKILYDSEITVYSQNGKILLRFDVYDEPLNSIWKQEEKLREVFTLCVVESVSIESRS